MSRVLARSLAYKKNIVSPEIMKVLYVGHDNTEPNEFCPGSTVCMALVEKISAKIRVQNCDILRQHQDLPEWLNGTPILIDDVAQEPHRGTEAVRVLQKILKMEEAARKAEPMEPPPLSQKPAAAARTVAHAPPRMDPAQTRQPSSSKQPEETEVESAMLDAELPDTTQDATANGSVENVPLGNGKIDDNDLQRFMEARKNSPASATASTQPQQ